MSALACGRSHGPALSKCLPAWLRYSSVWTRGIHKPSPCSTAPKSGVRLLYRVYPRTNWVHCMRNITVPWIHRHYQSSRYPLTNTLSHRIEVDKYRLYAIQGQHIPVCIGTSHLETIIGIMANIWPTWFKTTRHSLHPRGSDSALPFDPMVSTIVTANGGIFCGMSVVSVLSFLIWSRYFGWQSGWVHRNSLSNDPAKKW